MTTTVICKQSFEQLAEAAKLEGMTPEAILNKALEQFRTTDKQAHSPSSPLLDADTLKPFRDFEELTGVRAENPIHEALDDYAECCLSVSVEELADPTKSA